MKLSITQLACHMRRKLRQISLCVGSLGNEATTDKVTEILDLILDMQIFIDRLFYEESKEGECDR